MLKQVLGLFQMLDSKVETCLVLKFIIVMASKLSSISNKVIDRESLLILCNMLFPSPANHKNYLSCRQNTILAWTRTRRPLYHKLIGPLFYSKSRRTLNRVVLASRQADMTRRPLHHRNQFICSVLFVLLFGDKLSEEL